MKNSSMTDMYLYKYNKYKFLAEQNPNKQIYHLKKNYYDESNLNGDVTSDISGGGPIDSLRASKMGSKARTSICQETGRLYLYCFIEYLKTGEFRLLAREKLAGKFTYLRKDKLDVDEFFSKTSPNSELQKTQFEYLKGCLGNKINFEYVYGTDNKFNGTRWEEVEKGQVAKHSQGKTIVEYILDDTFCTLDADKRLVLLKYFVNELGAPVNCMISKSK